MKMLVILAIIFLYIICLMPSQSKINFQYECIGKEATATTYSYLREPRVEETGYTRGLKSSSFNYLENGTINLKENINYGYGNGTNISNSTVNHDLSVEFKGDRGISEFFAKGFFGNNRWASAWKKIRYEESPNFKKNGTVMEYHPSNSIKVDAHAYMNTSDINKTDYIFLYHADLKNGVIETKDSVGWTNRSGSNRYDWEHESLSSGKDLQITNDLVESERIIPEAGLEGEWLPCWCSGTIPAIEQLDTGWPTHVTKTVLEANRILPSAQLLPVNATLHRLSPAGIAISSLGYRRGVANKQAIIGNIGLLNKKMPYSIQPLYILSSDSNEVAFDSSNKSKNTSRISNMAGSVSATVYPESKSLKLGLVTYMPETLKGPLKNKTSHNIVDYDLEADCKDGSCNGFEGIYTYDQGPTIGSSAAAIAGEVPLVLIKNIVVTLEMAHLDNNTTTYFNLADGRENSYSTKQVLYNILIHNAGSGKLSDVILSAELAKGIKYERAKYNDTPYSNRGYLKEYSIYPETPNEDLKTTVTWKLDTMNTGEFVSILVEAFAKKDVDETAIRVDVKGKASDGDEVVGSDSNPESECYLRYIPGTFSPGTPCFPEGDDCKKECPEWAKPL